VNVQADRDLLKAHLSQVRSLVVKPAQGRIVHPWLSVSYGQHYASWIYTWDAYHMALSFAATGEPGHLRHLVDNLLTYQKEDGFTPSMVHVTDGPRLISPPYHAQPYLCQAALIHTTHSNDLTWAADVFTRLTRYLRFFDTENAAPHGLYRYRVGWYGGFDNDIVHALMPPDSVISADLPSLLCMEYRSVARLADRLGQAREAEHWRRRHDELAQAIQAHLWDDAAHSYAALNLLHGRSGLSLPTPGLSGDIGRYALQSCSNLMPLYARIAPPQLARAMIERYVLHADHFWSPHGIRSLSRASEFYNNARWGNPPRFGDYRRLTNSNWQGPVWFPLCYFMAQALWHYGYGQQAALLADRIVATLAGSIRAQGSMAENFDGETGAPLYCTEFGSWNLLADTLHDSLATGRWANGAVWEA
jgi:hypothetical protein